MRRNTRRVIRRRRRNPTAAQVVYGPMGAPFAGGTSSTPAKTKGKRRRARKLMSKQRRNRTLRRRLLKRVRKTHASARKAPRGSLRRSVLTTQAHRLSTLRRALAKGRPMKRSPVYKAMHVKSNPGVAGLVNAAKVILPQVGAGAIGLVVAAWAGKKVSAMIVQDGTGKTRTTFVGKDGAEVAIVKYMPSISTGVVAVAGYLIADKFAPKFKGAIVIGGMLGAVVQAIMAASASAPADSIMAKVRNALLGPAVALIPGAAPGEAAAGVGGGMFHEIGDYTMVGDAYGTGRPRPSADNATQWAVGAYGQSQRPRPSADNRTQWAVNGMDDATEFAPGEGGVLSGGIFR